MYVVLPSSCSKRDGGFSNVTIKQSCCCDFPNDALDEHGLAAVAFTCHPCAASALIFCSASSVDRDNTWYLFVSIWAPQMDEPVARSARRRQRTAIENMSTLRQRQPTIRLRRAPRSGELRREARAQLRGPAAVDTRHHPQRAVAAERRAVGTVTGELHVEVNLVGARSDGVAKIPRAVMPACARAGVEVVEVALRAFPHLHANTGQPVVREVQRVCKRRGVARVQGGEMAVEHFHRRMDGLGVRSGLLLHS